MAVQPIPRFVSFRSIGLSLIVAKKIKGFLGWRIHFSCSIFFYFLANLFSITARFLLYGDQKYSVLMLIRTGLGIDVSPIEL